MRNTSVDQGPLPFKETFHLFRTILTVPKYFRTPLVQRGSPIPVACQDAVHAWKYRDRGVWHSLPLIVCI